MFDKIKGFTLIELLIVVAIIAILAAIAVPNFLEAQVRAKVTRGKNDMRAMAVALEAYKIDTNKYPLDYQFYQLANDLSNQFAMCCLGRVTTPIAYMTSIPANVFKYKAGFAYDGNPFWYGFKTAESWGGIVAAGELGIDPGMSTTGQWVLFSCGPDQAPSGGEYALFGEAHLTKMTPINGTDPMWGNGPAIYDATNGTISAGDIVRVGP